MKKHTRKTDAARTPSELDATAAGVIEALAKMDPREGYEGNAAQVFDVTKAVDAMIERKAKTFAEQVRADGPHYRGPGNRPGWIIAMTTAEGFPISTAYKVIGSLKARALALALCRDHRLPLHFAQVRAA